MGNYQHYYKVLSLFFPSLGFSLDDYIIDFYESPEDWIMKVDGKCLSFNTHLLSVISEQYYELIIVHEAFHALRHGLANKSDVITLKDTLGGLIMGIFDIEADLVAIQFFHKTRGYSFETIALLLIEGLIAFHDKRGIRSSKFDRFLGTMVSVFLYYTTSKKVIVLPKSDSRLYGDKIFVLVQEEENFSFQFIKVSQEMLETLREIYWDFIPMKIEDRVDTLIQCVKALATQLTIQTHIQIV